MAVKIGTKDLEECYIGGVSTQVYTFDFVNDGQQGWSNLTGFNTTYVEGGFINGEGFYLKTKNGIGTEAGFTTIAGGLPSGTLKKIKIWYYLPSSQTGAGINDSASGTSSGYRLEHNDKMGFGSSTVTIGNYTGELTTEYNLTPTGCTGTCAGQSFSFTTNQANNFITAYNNGTFRLYLVTWDEIDAVYLRKVQLTIDV